MPEKITVLLVDDHALVRRGFPHMLLDHDDMAVVGGAGNGEDAVRLAQQLKPRVIVMDCALPGMGGLAATRRILVNCGTPAPALLMLRMHSEETLVQQAMAAGARGYILKSAMDLDLAAAVRKAAAGDTVLDPQLARGSNLRGERAPGLTQRELQILQLIVDGKSNKEIADQLDLSVNTVAVHRANIMDALGIHKTAELVVYAIRNGLVNIP